MPLGGTLAALVRNSGLGEDGLVVVECGRLGALHVGEPAQVLVRDLAERDAMSWETSSAAVTISQRAGGRGWKTSRRTGLAMPLLITHGRSEVESSGGSLMRRA